MAYYESPKWCHNRVLFIIIKKFTLFSCEVPDLVVIQLRRLSKLTLMMDLKVEKKQKTIVICKFVMLLTLFKHYFYKSSIFLENNTYAFHIFSFKF